MQNVWKICPITSVKKYTHTHYSTYNLASLTKNKSLVLGWGRTGTKYHQA